MKIAKIQCKNKKWISAFAGKAEANIEYSFGFAQDKLT
jgi:hypothetical protein